MLTVALRRAGAAARQGKAAVMDAVVESGEYILAKTPEMLPVLKQAGVVDAGGKGLLLIFKGFKSALSGEAVEAAQAGPAEEAAPMDDAGIIKGDLGEIEYGYCTEYFIQHIRRAVNETTLGTLRANLEKIGDSVVVGGDDSLIKVHVHTSHPGQALQHGLDLGELDQVKIDNMWEQNRRLKGGRFGGAGRPEVRAGGGGHGRRLRRDHERPERRQDHLLRTDDEPEHRGINQRSRRRARRTSSSSQQQNVFLAAQQSAEQAAVNGGNVYVVPTYSILQGIGGVLAFHPEADFEENRERIDNAIAQVYSGYVTYAVRDSVMDDKSIRKGDYLGIGNGQLLESGPDMEKVIFDLLRKAGAGPGQRHHRLLQPGRDRRRAVALADRMRTRVSRMRRGHL